MSREIKFRAQRLDNKEWIYGDLIRLSKLDPFTYIAKGIGYKVDDRELAKAIKVYPHTLGQYTGLKDRNGVEIYEGDIVGMIHEKHGLQNTKKIVWDEVHACFDWEDANDDSWPDGFTGFYDEYEVIGNIYENPELLEAER